MCTKPIKLIHVAIGAAFITSMFAISANADWLSEQRAISDGTSMGGPAVSGQEARGPEGKPAKPMGGGTDPFFEHQRAITDGQ